MSDAILYVSFGGPEKPDDILPFLETVTKGRGIPRERLLEVAEHYHHLGGRSPINDQNRAIIGRLTALLDQHGPRLPVYWGNRNWHPLLPDTLLQMKVDGITRAFVFLTSAFSSYSGCRQYLENIEQAKIAAVFPDLEIVKLRTYFNHPGFLQPFIDHTRSALQELPGARLVFTAHSIPASMAQGSAYESQLREAAKRIAENSGAGEFDLVWQSRSGAAHIPWLEPDILDHLTSLPQSGVRSVVIVPVGFVSDHVEVLYDLDTEAAARCAELGIRMKRVATPGSDPRFAAMIRELILERKEGLLPRTLAPSTPVLHTCYESCCPGPPARVRTLQPVSG